MSAGYHTRRSCPLRVCCRAGDRLTYFRLPWAEPAAPSSITILYEDEHVVSTAANHGFCKSSSSRSCSTSHTCVLLRLLAFALLSQHCIMPCCCCCCHSRPAHLQLGLAKPAGLQVLPKASFCQRTVLGLLQAYQQQVRRLRHPGSQQPVPVHRLGRGTSGELFNSVCKLHWAAAHCSAELSSTTAGFCVCNRFRRLHVGDVEQRPAHLGDAFNVTLVLLGPAGVLLCSCSLAARQKLCRDFSASTELGVLGSRMGDSAVQHTTASVGSDSSSSSGAATASERPLGKTYRALVSGTVQPNEVSKRWCTAAAAVEYSCKIVCGPA